MFERSRIHFALSSPGRAGFLEIRLIGGIETQAVCGRVAGTTLVCGEGRRTSRVIPTIDVLIQ